MALLLGQAIALIIGVFKMWTRVYTCCTQCLFCGFNLGVFIYSGVLRFNTKGSLAAISQTPVYPEGAIQSDRTYVNDA